MACPSGVSVGLISLSRPNTKVDYRTMFLHLHAIKQQKVILELIKKF